MTTSDFLATTGATLIGTHPTILHLAGMACKWIAVHMVAIPLAIIRSKL